MLEPKPESRISSLEKRATTIEATLIELSSDTAEELKAVRKDIKELDEGMRASFKTIGDTFVAVETNIGKRLDKIEATQNEHSQKLDEQGQRQDKMDSKLDQILTLLQQKPGGEK